MGNVMDNCRRWPVGSRCPVMQAAASGPAARTSPVLEVSSHSDSALGEGGYSRTTKTGISSCKDFSQLSVRLRVLFVGCNSQVCGDETCRASLQGLVSTAAAAQLRELSPELEALPALGTCVQLCSDSPDKVPIPGWILCCLRTRRGRTHPLQAFSLLSPLEQPQKVSKGVFVLLCFSLFELLEAAEGRTIAPAASLTPLRSQALLRGTVRMPKVTFSPSPPAPLPPCITGWLLPLHTWSLCKRLLGADVIISLLLCLHTDIFVHNSGLRSCWPFNGKKIPCSIAICFLFLVLGHSEAGGSAAPLLQAAAPRPSPRGDSLSHLCPAPSATRERPPREGAWLAASGIAIAAEIPALGLSSFWQKPFCALLLLLAWPEARLALRMWLPGAKHYCHSTY